MARSAASRGAPFDPAVRVASWISEFVLARASQCIQSREGKMQVQHLILLVSCNPELSYLIRHVVEFGCVRIPLPISFVNGFHDVARCLPPPLPPNTRYSVCVVVAQPGDGAPVNTLGNFASKVIPVEQLLYSEGAAAASLSVPSFGVRSCSPPIFPSSCFPE